MNEYRKKLRANIDDEINLQDIERLKSSLTNFIQNEEIIQEYPNNELPKVAEKSVCLEIIDRIISGIRINGTGGLTSQQQLNFNNNIQNFLNDSNEYVVYYCTHSQYNQKIAITNYGKVFFTYYQNTNYNVLVSIHCTDLNVIQMNKKILDAIVHSCESKWDNCGHGTLIRPRIINHSRLINKWLGIVERKDEIERQEIFNPVRTINLCIKYNNGTCELYIPDLFVGETIGYLRQIIFSKIGRSNIFPSWQSSSTIYDYEINGNQPISI